MNKYSEMISLEEMLTKQFQGRKNRRLADINHEEKKG